MDKIYWEDRMIGISGPRSAGKTTLMLQYMKTHLPPGAEALYVSLDDIYFADHPLVYNSSPILFQRKSLESSQGTG